MKLIKRLPKVVRTILVAIVLLAAISVAIYAARRAWPSGSSEIAPLVVPVQPRDFTLKIYADGELQSVESMTIAVPSVPIERLRIATVVADGRHVNKGDTLVEFDQEEMDLQMLEQRSNLEMSNQKINKGELGSNVEKTDIIKDKRIAELELQKINEFMPRDTLIYSQRDIIEGQLNKDFSEKKLVFADARLLLKGKVYTLDEAILLLERQQANTKIGQIERAFASLKLVSPASGIVVYNNPEYFFGGFSIQPGRTVWIGSTLFNLVNPDKMEAKCFVLEKDAGELKTDQPVTVTLDPFPGQEFTGKVKSIDNLARPIDQGSPVKYFQVIVSLDKTDPNLMKPGVKMKAQIRASELKSVIVVPRSAVIKKDSNFAVYVRKSPGQFEPVKVKLGQGDLIQVVVTEGLQAGQSLALNPPDVKRESKDESKKDK
ncbi:MAG TPA: HlyD family efflux transporter periplasmic adaptor subunit [Blastocatellia bacterium]|nr:HlyD family efflux transporter periplasmic adaptor subunit [Blastocatellia bacterium]